MLVMFFPFPSPDRRRAIACRAPSTMRLWSLQVSTSFPPRNTFRRKIPLARALSRFYRQNGNSNEGCALFADFSKFFDSIDHGILFKLLAGHIGDERVLGLTRRFVSVFGPGKSLGLGSHVSQVAAIFYPNKLDHFIKEKLRVKFYGGTWTTSTSSTPTGISETLPVRDKTRVPDSRPRPEREKDAHRETVPGRGVPEGEIRAPRVRQDFETPRQELRP
jgi:hypothetical protein